MTTTSKLWLGFGTLTILLVLICLAIILRLSFVMRQLDEMAVARNRSASTRKLEVHLAEYSIALHRHVLREHPQSRQRVAEHADRVGHQQAAYERLARTPRHRQAASRFAAQWNEVQRRGETILNVEDLLARQEELARFDQLHGNLDDFVIHQMQSEALQDYEASQDAVREDVQEIRRFVFVLLAGGAAIAILSSGVAGRGILAAEARLRASEERMRLAADAAGFGTFDADLTTGTLLWSDVLKRIFGLPPEASPPGNPLDVGLIHPEDAERLRAKQWAWLDSAGEGTLEDEHRILRADGTERWVLLKGKAYFGGAGSERRALRLFGAVIDITERKQAEEALRRQEQELSLLNSSLEQRIAQRTRELQTQTAQLQLLAQELVQTEQRQRKRFSQMLHDGLQQVLVAINFRLAVLAESNQQEELVEHVQRAQSLLQEAVNLSRSLSVELSPPVLHQAGLPAALQWLVTQFADRQGLQVDLRVQQALPPVEEVAKEFLFGAAREMLLNAAKHAKVDRVEMRLGSPGPGWIVLEVQDRGQGFQYESAQQSSTTPTGFGLLSLRERAEAMGGSLQIVSTPGQGARLTLTLPSRMFPSTEHASRSA